MKQGPYSTYRNHRQALFQTVTRCVMVKVISITCCYDKTDCARPMLQQVGNQCGHAKHNPICPVLHLLNGRF